MTRWRKWWLGLAVAVGIAKGAWAQAPALPGAAAPAAAPGTAPGAMVAGAAGSADVAPPVPGGMLGNFITGCEYLKFKCKQCMCNSVFGQLMNNSLKPMTAFSGGLVPPLCPPNGVNPADLAKPADSAAGAAARIKADEADAKARVAAVRYLGTVDCHYWPEAQDALINALRADRNECVRLAAAVALGNGCCCTPKTIIALNITVAGTDEDGNPSETSERVRGTAYVALSQCVERFPPPAETGPKPELPPERPPEGPGKPPVPNTGAATKPGEKTKVVPAAYYERVAATPMPQVLTRARQSLQANAVTTTAPVNGPTPGAAKQGLLGIAFNAIASTTPEPAPPIVADSSAPPPAPTRVIEVIPTVRNTTPPAPLAPVPAVPLPVEPLKTRSPSVVPVTPSAPPLVFPVIPPPAPVQSSFPYHGATPSMAGSMEVKVKSSVPAPPTIEPMPIITPPAKPMPTLVPPPLSVKPPQPANPPAFSAGFYGAAPDRSHSVPPAAPVVVDVSRIPPPLPAPLPVVRPQPAASAVMVAGFYGTPVERPHPAAPPVVAAPEADEHPSRWVSLLREAPDPEARDWAASRLQNVNWRAHPEVIHALVTGALKDPTSSVRTACIRTLEHMDAGTTSVLSALDTLAADRDPAVKHAAKEALQDLLARRRQ